MQIRMVYFAVVVARWRQIQYLNSFFSCVLSNSDTDKLYRVFQKLKLHFLLNIPGGYGQWTRGARVIEIDSSKDIWTERRNYIVLENGTIVDEYAAPA